MLSQNPILKEFLIPEMEVSNDKTTPIEVVLGDTVFDDLYNSLRTAGRRLDPSVWRCPPATPSDWLLGKEYLNLSGSIRKPVFDDIVEFLRYEKDPWDRVYDEAILCEGIGSGKSFKTSCIATYFTHLLLCLKNPQEFFGIDSSSKIAIMNMCFAGDQKVRLTNGVELTFKELYQLGKKVEVTAYDVKNDRFVKATTERAVSSGVKKIKKITFGNGRVLRLTANHPLLTRERDEKGRYTNVPVWRKVEELREGDIVKMGQFVGGGKPSGYTADELKLLAYIYGDSEIMESGVNFITSYRRIVTDFKEVCEKFGVTSFKEHDRGDLHCIEAESPKIMNLINKAKIKKNENDRTLPSELIQAPEDELALFLSRLWTTYGSVNVGHKLSINFTTPSLSLLEEISDILSRFGIICRLYMSNGRYKKDEDVDTYRLSISDTISKQRFMDNIGRYGLKLEGCKMVKGNMGRRFEWTNIESIGDDGEEETFDIEVPELHNLVVNGMVCHNSISEKNARSVIFSEIKQKIYECKWFQDRPWGIADSRMPDPNCMSELRFRSNLFIIAGSSSWRSAVGYNIIFGIVDEAGSYRATDLSDQAEDIYLTLKRRLGSRFESKGAIVVVGSPMYESDFLERRIEMGEAQNSKAYVKRRSLWEAKYYDWEGDFFYIDKVNNIVLKGKPENMKDVDTVPKVPFLYEAFCANVTKAYRDFGARPSAVIHGFFENPKILLDNVNRTRDSEPMDRAGRFKEWFKPVRQDAFHTVHVDLALSGDACGITMGHYNGVTEAGGVKVYIDLMMRLVGTPENKIQFSQVREYIYALTSLGFKIDLITYDGWQSTDSMQILGKKGYRVDVLSVDKTMLPYTNLKEAVFENRVDYYRVPSGDPDRPSASETFVKECMRLEEIEGKKVDHPPKGSKDVADSVAGVVHNVVTKHGQFSEVVVQIL